MDQFAKSIRDAIESQDMTIMELSRRTGVTRQHLYRILAGEHAPSLSVAERIAEALGLTLTVSQKSSEVH